MKAVLGRHPERRLRQAVHRRPGRRRPRSSPSCAPRVRRTPSRAPAASCASSWPGSTPAATPTTSRAPPRADPRPVGRRTTRMPGTHSGVPGIRASGSGDSRGLGLEATERRDRRLCTVEALVEGWPVWAVFVVLWLGALARGTATYWVGRGVRAGGGRSRWAHHLDRPLVARAERFVRRVGPPAVTLGFLTVGLQSAINASAGMLRMPQRRFVPAVAPGGGAVVARLHDGGVRRRRRLPRLGRLVVAARRRGARRRRRPRVPPGPSPRRGRAAARARRSRVAATRRDRALRRSRCCDHDMYCAVARDAKRRGGCARRRSAGDRPGVGGPSYRRSMTQWREVIEGVTVALGGDRVRGRVLLEEAWDGTDDTPPRPAVRHRALPRRRPGRPRRRGRVGRARPRRLRRGVRRRPHPRRHRARRGDGAEPAPQPRRRVPAAGEGRGGRGAGRPRAGLPRHPRARRLRRPRAPGGARPRRAGRGGLG